jgi:choline dehydrogenase-like flavoprotein
MSIESQLRDKLRKIEASFAGAGTAGGRLAAEAALARVRVRLAELGQQDPPVESQFSMPDQWSRHLFLALCRRYGLQPYRLYRQRRNTVMVRAPRASSIKCCGWSSPSSTAPCRPIFTRSRCASSARKSMPTPAMRRRFPRHCRRTDGLVAALRPLLSGKNSLISVRFLKGNDATADQVGTR